MTDKRYLFRGFHPDENGKTVITFNGEEIRGDWVYWDAFGNRLVDEDETSFSGITYDDPNDIIPETVGPFVTTDKNGKDIFLGDKVYDEYNDHVYLVEW